MYSSYQRAWIAARPSVDLAYEKYGESEFIVAGDCKVQLYLSSLRVGPS
jgi:hypothetical protein